MALRWSARCSHPRTLSKTSSCVAACRCALRRAARRTISRATRHGRRSAVVAPGLGHRGVDGPRPPAAQPDNRPAHSRSRRRRLGAGVRWGRRVADLVAGDGRDVLQVDGRPARSFMAMRSSTWATWIAWSPSRAGSARDAQLRVVDARRGPGGRRGCPGRWPVRGRRRRPATRDRVGSRPRGWASTPRSCASISSRAAASRRSWRGSGAGTMSRSSVARREPWRIAAMPPTTT